MKNRILRICTALVAALVMMGGFSVSAYAGGGPENEEPESLPIEEISETDDYGVNVPEPLTPDGNLTLVDDISGEASGDKQFITVVTRNGNCFYIIIDRAEDGENTVHFLNQVDEADLMAILDELDGSPAPAVTVEPEPDPEPTPDPESEPEAEKSGGMGGVVIFVLVLALGEGAAFYYVKVMKPKQSTKGGDLDDFDFEDDEEPEPEVFEAEQEDTE
ncbi:DUF4366 domain-containing protein [Eisenbergiella tayi]|uniref:DUF4366 domain-containing protein n=1 Tax=Eisenbergiella tayi TaxID=1432052 RepID=UPI00084949AD|nr:DUF4366 domain-containing protein [Eisenbergiella tayi]ODR33133.1 cell surface protein [Eisenbergiella tayi]